MNIDEGNAERRKAKDNCRDNITIKMMDQFLDLTEMSLCLCEKYFTNANPTKTRHFPKQTRRRKNVGETTNTIKALEEIRTYIVLKIIQSLDYLSVAVKACVKIYGRAFADYVVAYQRDRRELVDDRRISSLPSLAPFSTSTTIRRKLRGNTNDYSITERDYETSSASNKETDLELNYSVKMLDWLLCILDNDENFSSLWTCVKSTANFEESTTMYDSPVVFSSGGILGLGICEKRYVIECELEMRLYRTLDRLGKLDLYDAAKNLLHAHMGQIKRFIHMYERAVNLKSDPELVSRNLNKFFSDIDMMARNMFYIVLMNVERDQVVQAFNNIHSGVDTVKREILAILQNFRGTVGSAVAGSSHVVTKGATDKVTNDNNGGDIDVETSERWSNHVTKNNSQVGKGRKRRSDTTDTVRDNNAKTAACKSRKILKRATLQINDDDTCGDLLLRYANKRKEGEDEEEDDEDEEA